MKPWSSIFGRSGTRSMAVLCAGVFFACVPAIARAAGVVGPGTGHMHCSIGAYEADVTALEVCVGDCTGTQTVAVNDIITLVNVALGISQTSACPHGVPSGAAVDITLITKAVNAALNGCPAPAEALFSSDPLNPANPFPSDRLLDSTGHVHVTGALIGADLPNTSQYDKARAMADTIAGRLAATTGFSTFAPIRIKFDHAVKVPDPKLHEGIQVLQYDTLSVAAPVTATAVTPDVSGDFAIEIQPVVPLLPKTRYVYVVTRAVHDEHNNPIRPSDDLVTLLHGRDGTGTWRAALDPVLQYLQAQQGIGVDDIAAIELFTTQPTTDDLIAIRHLFDDGTLPPADPVFENPPIAGLHTGIFAEGTPEFTDVVGTATSPNIAAVAIGVFDSFDFRVDGVFDPARVSGSVQPSVNHLDFYVTIPKAAPPPGGYPITLYGHGGTSLGKDQVVAVSRVVGAAPMMAIAISAVYSTARGQNNLLDDSGFVTRDNFRQTVADYLQLERMVRRATVPPFDQVDKSRIHYMGWSNGGMMGTLYMGVEPDVQVGMLSVPGGGLPDILSNIFYYPGSLVRTRLAVEQGIPVADFPVFFHRFLQVAQWILDPADPINTAPYITDPARRLAGVPPKHILMHEGIVDTVIPNFNNDALALAMGLPDVKATHGCASADGCSGIWRFVMTDYGQDAGSGHDVTLPFPVKSAPFLVPQASVQAGHYLVTDGDEIIDAAP